MTVVDLRQSRSNRTRAWSAASPQRLTEAKFKEGLDRRLSWVPAALEEMHLEERRAKRRAETATRRARKEQRLAQLPAKLLTGFIVPAAPEPEPHQLDLFDDRNGGGPR
jgi:hypothetical protein